MIEFIKELHQVLQSLESNKRRRKSVSPSPSPRPLVAVADGFENGVDVGACCNSSVADVEAKISGSNVLLKIISRRIPGQLSKMISVLERLSFEVLHLNISSMDDTVLYSFVVKVYTKIGLTSFVWVFWLEILQTLIFSSQKSSFFHL